jgi:hypothetical protein
MTITFSSDQQITALTMAGNGASINNAVTLLPAKTSVTYVYRATGTTWWPTQNVPGILTNGIQFFRLDANLAGANVSTAQSTLGVGVTLSASTVYKFEIVFALSRTAGAVSHTVAINFTGGSATLNNIAYFAQGFTNASASAINTFTLYGASATGISTGVISTAASTNVTTATTAANEVISLMLKGTVSINAGGTFFPQYICSSAPGGAFTTVAGSYMLIYPIGASGANVNVGSWA